MASPIMCRPCGTEIPRKVGRGQQARYCSTQCKNYWLRQKRLGVAEADIHCPPPTERPEYRIRDCLRCGASLEGKRPHAKFCSRKCKMASSDSIRETRDRRNGLEFGAIPYTVGDWTRQLRRLGSKCFYCGSRGRLTRDHVVPLSRGGIDSLSNIVPACRPCNSSKGNRFLIEWPRRPKGVISSLQANKQSIPL